MWSQLSAEQKLNYGEDYFERALRSLEKYTEKVIVSLFSICSLQVYASSRPDAIPSKHFFHTMNRMLTSAQPLDV